ncbi:MAG: HAD hydrolase-like protein [Ignavibacteria bacterium]|jgi:putative hydrolase of the HAD superfamily
MIFIFDLDDTLYDESSYVSSGFKTVSKYLEKNYKVNSSEAFNYMMKDLRKNGRGKIFNNVLEKYSLFTNSRLKKLVSVYRMHIPDIKLYKDSLNIFKTFRDSPKYVVTDGNKIVQNIKCNALKLDKYIKKIFITYRYGIKNSKPSTYCFNKILQIEKAKPNNVLCIGDNPNKDFFNLNKEGFYTVRIMRGMFKEVKVDKENDGKLIIKSLNEITPKFIKSLNQIEKFQYS